VADVSLDALTRSCRQFASGKVSRNNAFPPAAAELAENARLWQEALNTRNDPGVKLYNGLIECDWGQGRVDMRGLTEAEQDQIIANKGCGPDGKSLAYMPLEAIRAALKAEAIEGTTRKVVAALQGMS
jgi:hypothetical protein